MINAILASTNQHKVREISDLVDSRILELTLPPHKLDVVENGDSFAANALLKAQSYFEQFGSIALADDSGLVVNALPDELGIHSARFGGEELGSEAKNHLLLKKLQDKRDRSAYYVCVLCLYLHPQEIYFFEGRLLGTIALQSEGSGGFGYDPLFIAEGQSKSVATMPEWKAKHSHRAKACKVLEKFLQNRESA